MGLTRRRVAQWGGALAHWRTFLAQTLFIVLVVIVCSKGFAMADGRARALRQAVEEQGPSRLPPGTGGPCKGRAPVPGRRRRRRRHLIGGNNFSCTVWSQSFDILMNVTFLV